MRPPVGEEKERFVKGMFDAIAPRYDRLNRVISFGMDDAWRRRAVAALAPRSGGHYLDIGTGTGDLAAATAAHASAARVTGIDLAGAMLPLARAKGVTEVAQASALVLPFDAHVFDGATNAFVLRNVKDLRAFFTEARRVLKPGARLVSLEIGRPTGRVFGPLYGLYFYGIMPRIGRALSGDPEAYAYLAASVKHVPTADEIVAVVQAAGFRDVTVTPLMRGALAVIVAVA